MVTLSWIDVERTSELTLAIEQHSAGPLPHAIAFLELPTTGTPRLKSWANMQKRDQRSKSHVIDIIHNL